MTETGSAAWVDVSVTLRNGMPHWPAAVHLAEARVRTVGIDYLSVGGYHSNGAEIHRILLTAGIWIIEGLDLSAVRAGPYELICLPVKLHSSDGAPARAILRPITEGHQERA